MVRKNIFFHVFFGTILLLIFTANVVTAKGIRVASLNVCTDQLIVLLADPDQISSLTFLSDNRKYSYVFDRVSSFNKNHGSAEEIIASQADIVITAQGAAGSAVRILKRAGFSTVNIPIATSFKDIRANIKLVAKLLGQESRGNEMLRAMDSSLHKIKKSTNVAPDSPVAVVIGLNGFSSGSNTLVHSVLERAGFRNGAAILGIRGFGRVTLEELAILNPSILIFEKNFRKDSSLASGFLLHPILQKIKESADIVWIDSALWSCGGPYTSHAIQQLIEKK